MPYRQVGSTRLPTVTVTTSDTHGNEDIIRQTKFMNVVKPKRAKSLHLPYRRMRSSDRAKEDPNAHWRHNRPSFSLRVGKSSPEMRQMVEHGERQIQLDNWRRLEEVMAKRPPPSATDDVRIGCDERKAEEASPGRTPSMPPMPSKMSDKAADDLLDQFTSLKAAMDGVDEDSIERGRRTTKFPSKRTESSADSEIWERRGRSRCPRPKPGEQMELPPPKSEIKTAKPRTEAEKGKLKVPGVGVSGSKGKQKARIEQSPGWVPAQDPESER